MAEQLWNAAHGFLCCVWMSEDVNFSSSLSWVVLASLISKCALWLSENFNSTRTHYITFCFDFETGCQLQRDHSIAPANRSIEVSTRTECQKKLSESFAAR